MGPFRGRRGLGLGLLAGFWDVEVRDEGPFSRGAARREGPAGDLAVAATRWSALDILGCLAVALVAWWSLAQQFWTHNWVAINWGDWYDQAYRVRFLQAWGLVNWDPDWDRGLPIFQSYQTLPHAAALAILNLGAGSIPHSMMVATALLVILLPVTAYLALRALGCGVPAGLLGAALVIDIPAVAAPIRDYSSLYGVAMVPIVCWAVMGALGTRKGYVGAVLVGVTPYLHPFGAVAALYLVLARLMRREGWASWRLARQLGVAALVAAFYWLPLLTSARPRFEDPWNFSVGFERSVLPNDGLMGLSIGLAVALVLAVILASRGRLANARITRIGVRAAVLMALTAGLAYMGWLPRQLMETDPVRWTPELGVILALAAAPVGDAAWLAVRDRRLGPRLAAASLGCALVVGIAAEGMAWNRASNVPLSNSLSYGHELGDYARAHGFARPTLVWTSTDFLANSSFVDFGQFQFTGDYVSQRQWTQTGPVLQELLQDDVAGMPIRTGEFDQVETYLRMYGVEYLYLPRYAASTASFLTGPLSGHFTRVVDLPAGFLVKVPWTPTTAFVTRAGAVDRTTLPQWDYLTFDQQRTRDRLVAQYVALQTDPSDTPATMTWQSPTKVTVHAEAAAGQDLVVPQNWDTVWQASSGGQALPIRRAGPNFMAIALGGRTGPVVVELTHGGYPSWSVAVVLVALGLLAALAGTVVDSGARRAVRARIRVAGDSPA